MAVVFVMGDAVLSRLVDSVIFHPEAGAELGLDALGLEGHELFLRTEDGVRIHLSLIHI